MREKDIKDNQPRHNCMTKGGGSLDSNSNYETHRNELTGHGPNNSEEEKKKLKSSPNLLI